MELRKIQLPKDIKESITANIPESLIKEREGGGKKMLSYISGSTVTDMLNHAFGYLWDWKIEKEWIEEGKPYFNKWKKPEPGWEEQGSICHVRGTLTVYMSDLDGHTFAINKSGYGSKSILGKQNDQESIFKAAGTDALKKAASLLGIGLELYRDEEEQMHFDSLNYEDPWTDELKEKYSVELEYVRNVMTEYELSAEEMDPYIEEFSDGALSYLSDLTPDNIEAFTEWLRAKIEAAKESE